MQRYQQQPNQSHQSNKKFVSIGSSLIQAFIKSKTTMSKKDTVEALKKYSQFNRKRTELFVKSISKILSKKQLISKKNFIGRLLQSRISDILLKREKVSQLKVNARKKSLTLISAIFLRNLNNKLQDTFLEIRIKGSFRFQINNYKLALLTSSIKKKQRSILSDSLKKVKIESFRRLAQYKRCFILQRLYLKKRVQNMLQGFNSMFKFALSQNQQKSRKISEERQSFQQNPQFQQQKQIIVQLETQQNQLQQKLNQTASQLATAIQEQQTQLTSLQQQLQSIRFQYDLNLQDNTQLHQTLKQRQTNSNIIFQSESKNKANDGTTAKFKLSEEMLWQRVFSNLLLYLLKCQQQKQQPYDSTLLTTRQTETWSQQKLLQAFTEPLTQTHLYPNTQELIEQNHVLKELLETYKKAFPQIKVQNKSFTKLPGEILLKQRHFLVHSLECLSKWGTEAGDGLEGVKGALERIKAKKELQY